MADLSVDTSSYPKPSLPVSPLDIAGKLGGLQQQSQAIQQGAVNLDQSKLKLYNEHFQIMQNELSTLANDPETTKEEVLTRMHRIGDGFNMPEGVRKQMEAEFANVPSKVPLGKDGSTNPTLSRTLDLIMKRGMDMSQRINSQYGGQGSVNDGQNVTPSRTFLRGGPVPSGDPIAQQAPPTTLSVDSAGASTLLGAQPIQIPPNTTPTPGGFPGQYNNKLGVASPVITPPLPTGPMSPSRLPISPFIGKNETIKNVQVMPAQQAIVPRGAATGLPIGESGLMEAGAAHLAEERKRATNFQREVFPLAQAIPALETLGTKGTGPGTETINHLKSFILSNIPGVKESDFNGTVADYDKAKKYLTDFVNQTGNSGTNDKLAAAFAGNPSVGISNAAAVDVAKSALSLRRMQQAVYQEFEAQGLPARSFTRWLAQRTQQTDPRAFGVDMMSKDKLEALQKSFKTQQEADQFERSLNLAKNMGFY